jgi:hypothetical protein
MTIHWKALEEHILMVTLVLRLSKSPDKTIHWKGILGVVSDGTISFVIM